MKKLARRSPLGACLLALAPAAAAQTITVHNPLRTGPGWHLDVNRIEKTNPAANPGARGDRPGRQRGAPVPQPAAGLGLRRAREAAGRRPAAGHGVPARHPREDPGGGRLGRERALVLRPAGPGLPHPPRHGAAGERQHARDRPDRAVPPGHQPEQHPRRPGARGRPQRRRRVVLVGERARRRDAAPARGVAVHLQLPRPGAAGGLAHELRPVPAAQPVGGHRSALRRRQRPDQPARDEPGALDREGHRRRRVGLHGRHRPAPRAHDPPGHAGRGQHPPVRQRRVVRRPARVPRPLARDRDRPVDVGRRVELRDPRRGLHARREVQGGLRAALRALLLHQDDGRLPAPAQTATR